MVGYIFLSSNRFVATLTDIDGEPLDGATVNFRLTKMDGTAVSYPIPEPPDPPPVPMVWPQVMTGVGDGKYNYTPPYDLDLSNNTDYWAEITATGTGLQRFAKVKVHVQTDSN